MLLVTAQVAHARRIFPWELPGPSKSAAAFTVQTAAGAKVGIVGWGHRVKLVVSTPSPSNELEGSSGIVEYLARGEATKNGIEASFGDLGEVSVRFKSRRRIHRGSLPFPLPPLARGCGSRWGPDRLGVFVGRIELRGEGGYFAVDAHRAKGLVGRVPTSGCSQPVPGDAFGPGVCKKVEDEVGPSGAGVVSRSLLPTRKIFFGADRSELVSTAPSKTTSIRFALFLAGKLEDAGPLTISRSLIAVGPPATIAADASLGKVTITPPPQFSGTGVFQSSPTGSFESSGSLTAAFPGEPEATALVGPGFEGTACVARHG